MFFTLFIFFMNKKQKGIEIRGREKNKRRKRKKKRDTEGGKGEPHLILNVQQYDSNAY